MNNLTIDNTKNYCPYYTANVDRRQSYYFVAIIKAYDNMVFDRTIDADQSLFEFFVAPAYEQQFLNVMALFERKGLVTNLRKLPNRLAKPEEMV